MNSGIPELGSRIKHFRNLRHLTLEQLAEKVDVTLNFIQTTESGRNVPSVELFVKIAEALDVSPSELLSDGSFEKMIVPEFINLSLPDIRLITSTATSILNELLTNHTSFASNVGRRIHDYRLNAKLSRKELASKMEISPDQLRKIEVGVNFTTLKNLVAAMQTLNMPIEYFLQDECKTSNEYVLSKLLLEAKAKMTAAQYMALNNIIENLLNISNKN